MLGPLIVIPYVEREEKKDEKGQTVVQRVQHHRYLLPESLQVQGQPEVRKLGIYQTQVYQGPLNFKVRFGQPELADLQRANVTVGQPFLLVALSDSRGIKSISPLATPRPVAFEPGTGVGSLRQDPRTADAGGAATKAGLSADFTLTLAGTSSCHWCRWGAAAKHAAKQLAAPEFPRQLPAGRTQVTEQRV